LLTGEVSGDVPVVLQFVQIASDGAASEVAIECRHEVRSRGFPAVGAIASASDETPLSRWADCVPEDQRGPVRQAETTSRSRGDQRECRSTRGVRPLGPEERMLRMHQQSRPEST